MGRAYGVEWWMWKSVTHDTDWRGEIPDEPGDKRVGKTVISVDIEGSAIQYFGNPGKLIQKENSMKTKPTDGWKPRSYVE
jgi:hypothetical protein